MRTHCVRIPVVCTLDSTPSVALYDLPEFGGPVPLLIRRRRGIELFGLLPEYNVVKAYPPRLL